MRLGVIVAMFLTLAFAPAAGALPSYVVDGSIEDWGVQLDTFDSGWWWWSATSFDKDSFTPGAGTIDFVEEDRWPSWDEPYDYEAIYFDDTPSYFYVGVVSSHPWNPAKNTIRITANGYTYSTPDVDMFAWSDLNVDEATWLATYPNYFFEAAWSTARFDFAGEGTQVIVYANCCCCCCKGSDKIWLRDGTVNNPLPEPTTIALMGLGLLGLGVNRLAKRKRR